jgi:hypothetical protein
MSEGTLQCDRQSSISSSAHSGSCRADDAIRIAWRCTLDRGTIRRERLVASAEMIEHLSQQQLRARDDAEWRRRLRGDDGSQVFDG